MGLMKEFKEFAMKGNVVDLAVGVIIGAAFGGIVKSLTDDIIMPVVGGRLQNRIIFDTDPSHPESATFNRDPAGRAKQFLRRSNTNYRLIDAAGKRV